MRLAGVDHGGRWFGIALSDPTGTFARPLDVCDGEADAVEFLRRLIADQEVGGIVLGLPRNMDGTLGPKAKEVLRFAAALSTRLAVPVRTWDERLTSREAQQILHGAGLSARQVRQRENQVAAQILLQSFLDAGGWGRPEPSVSEEPPAGAEEDEPEESDGDDAE